MTTTADRTTPHRRTFMAVVAVLGLVASACSSGDDDDEASSSEPATEETVIEEPVVEETTAPTEPPAEEPADDATGDTTPEEPADEPDADTDDTGDEDAADDSGIPSEDADPDALAARALLTLDDFPEGWTATPPDPDSEDDVDLDGRIEDCVGLPADALSRGLDDIDVESPEFDSPDGSLTVEQSVVIVEDEATAIAIMGELSLPEVPGCVASVVGDYFAEVMSDPEQSDFPPGTELGEFVAEAIPLDADPSIVTGVYFEVPITVGEDELLLVMQTWYVRQGRALSQVQFQSIGTQFPSDGVGALLDGVAERLAAIG